MYVVSLIGWVMFNQRSMLVVIMSIQGSVVRLISVYTFVLAATDNKIWLIVNISPVRCSLSSVSRPCCDYYVLAPGQYKFNLALCRPTGSQWYYKYLIIVLIPLFALSQYLLSGCPLPLDHNTLSQYLLWLDDNTNLVTLKIVSFVVTF